MTINRNVILEPTPIYLYMSLTAPVVQELNKGEMIETTGEKKLGMGIYWIPVKLPNRSIGYIPATTQLLPLDETVNLGVMREVGKRKIMTGCLWLGGGVLVSLLSYKLAPSGSRFIVATGPMVFGIFKFITGLTDYNQSK